MIHLVPSNPSYAAFDYDGNFAEASFLAAEAVSGTSICEVDDGSLYSAGDWILVSDASTDPQNYLLPVDGPMEVRQVIAINGDELTVDRAWKRNHAINVIVALAVPFYRRLVPRPSIYRQRNCWCSYAHGTWLPIQRHHNYGLDRRNNVAR